jgi:hypothetical protein
MCGQPAGTTRLFRSALDSHGNWRKHRRATLLNLRATGKPRVSKWAITNALNTRRNSAASARQSGSQREPAARPGASARSATMSLRHHEQQSSRRRPNQPSSSNQRRGENAATRQKRAALAATTPARRLFLRTLEAGDDDGLAWLLRRHCARAARGAPRTRAIAGRPVAPTPERRQCICPAAVALTGAKASTLCLVWSQSSGTVGDPPATCDQAPAPEVSSPPLAQTGGTERIRQPVHSCCWPSAPVLTRSGGARCGLGA